MSYNSLYDIVTENAVLGYIFNFPSLLLEEEFTLTITDFYTRKNQILYSAANNLALEGVSKIEPIDMDIYLRRYPEQYAVYEEGQGIETLITLVNENAILDKAKFNILYQRLKKFALLRDLELSGISTEDFYSSDVFSNKNDFFENSNIDTFIDKVKEKVNDIEEKYKSRNDTKGISVADGLQALIEEYKITPSIGATLDGDIYNHVVRGARLGRMYITSSGSGGGKSRRMVGQACALSLPYLDSNRHIVLKKEYFPTVFFSTEQTTKEIQTMVLAYVSGVNEEKITDGLLYATDDEKERIQIAIKIIELFKDYLMLEQIPDPSIGIIRSKALQYIYKKNVQYIFYDYIFTSPSLVSEFAGSKLREDVVLLMLSNALKEIAAIYNVFIMSGTQLSGDYLKPGQRGMNLIRGSKSIADKVDAADITIRIPQEELELIEEIINTTGLKPNIVTDIYKNRSGSLTEIKIFSYFDYGTCRRTDYFMTDASYNPLSQEYSFIEEHKIVNSLEELIKEIGGIDNE